MSSSHERPPRIEHGLWPSPADERLLHAALDPGGSAADAWNDWLDGEDAANPPSRVLRCLPRVADRLRPQGVEHPLFAVADELRGHVARHNRVLIDAAIEAAAGLDAAGVQSLVLKGIVLVREYLRDEGLRAMADIDLMVRSADLPRADEVLRQLGWHPLQQSAALRPFRCAIDYEREVGPRDAAGVARRASAGVPPGQQLDLHQYLTDYGSTPAAEDEVWERARAIEVYGASLRAQSPTDLLVQSCLGGLRPGRDRNLRWVLAAHDVLAGGGVDWAALQRQIEEREIGLPLGECLAYLRAELRLPVPEEVLAAVAGRRVGAVERRRYSVLTRYSKTLPQLLEEHWCRYAFGAKAQGRSASPLGFALYLRWTLEEQWRVEGWRRILTRAFARLWRRLGPSPSAREGERRS